MKKLILIVPVLLLLLSSCSKDDDSGNNNNTYNPPAPGKKELISAKPWYYKKWTVSPPFQDSAGNMVSDYLNYLPACERDNIIILKANGISHVDQGAMKCNTTDPQVYDGTWFFTNNESAVNLGGNVYTIAGLTADSMKWTFDYTIGSTVHSHLIVFSH